jgi:phosphatidylserine decarboxylase
MPPVAREGWIIVVVVVVVAGLAAALASLAGPDCRGSGGGVGLLLTLWCIWFFRDPQRPIPDGPGWSLRPTVS